MILKANLAEMQVVLNSNPAEKQAELPGCAPTEGHFSNTESTSIQRSPLLSPPRDGEFLPISFSANVFREQPDYGSFKLGTWFASCSLCAMS